MKDGESTEEFLRKLQAKVYKTYERYKVQKSTTKFKVRSRVIQAEHRKLLERVSLLEEIYPKELKYKKVLRGFKWFESWHDKEIGLYPGSIIMNKRRAFIPVQFDLRTRELTHDAAKDLIIQLYGDYEVLPILIDPERFDYQDIARRTKFSFNTVKKQVSDYVQLGILKKLDKLGEHSMYLYSLGTWSRRPYEDKDGYQKYGKKYFFSSANEELLQSLLEYAVSLTTKGGFF